MIRALKPSHAVNKLAARIHRLSGIEPGKMLQLPFAAQLVGQALVKDSLLYP